MYNILFLFVFVFLFKKYAKPFVHFTLCNYFSFICVGHRFSTFLCRDSQNRYTICQSLSDLPIYIN